MFTSSAVVFRTRQAVRDLQEVVRTHRDAVDRIGTNGADRSDLMQIIDNGCLLSSEDRSYSSVLLAAALPDEDFNAFAVATAVLLADRLQDGGGTDDLFWNFDAFEDHYRLADSPVRAAIMNGFRAAHLTERVTLRDVPQPTFCLTRQREDVLQLLASEGQHQLFQDISASPAPEIAGKLWTGVAKEDLTLSVAAGLRYLYERPASMAPEAPETAKLIPWA